MITIYGLDAITVEGVQVKRGMQQKTAQEVEKMAKWEGTWFTIPEQPKEEKPEPKKPVAKKATAKSK